MGSAMACCGKSEADANNLNTNSGIVTVGKGAHLKIETIVKMQAAMRGFLARKRVHQLRQSNGGRTMMH